MKNEWWGYKHQNGHVQAKRYFSMEDIREADSSPFVLDTYGPFEAEGREEALNQLTAHFGGSAAPTPIHK